MAIEVEPLFGDKCRAFGASESSEDFLQRFIDAINYVFDDLENEVGLTANRIAVIHTSIDIDEQSFRGTISMGLDFYLSLYREYTVEQPEILERRYQRKLKQARRIYRATQDVYGKRGDMS
jgi:hypothetical protein